MAKPGFEPISPCSGICARLRSWWTILDFQTCMTMAYLDKMHLQTCAFSPWRTAPWARSTLVTCVGSLPPPSLPMLRSPFLTQLVSFPHSEPSDDLPLPLDQAFSAMALLAFGIGSFSAVGAALCTAGYLTTSCPHPITCRYILPPNPDLPKV